MKFDNFQIPYRVVKEACYATKSEHAPVRVRATRGQTRQHLAAVGLCGQGMSRDEPLVGHWQMY